VLERKAYEVQ
jgi:hypothetical protein